MAAPAPCPASPAQCTPQPLLLNVHQSLSCSLYTTASPARCMAAASVSWCSPIYYFSHVSVISVFEKTMCIAWTMHI
jgi:hypothetical protein